MRFLIAMFTLFCLALAPAWAKDGCECGSSCNCSQKTDQVSLEGRIAPAGPSIYMEGSHELHDGSGKVVARLSALGSGVDLQAHEGQWVKIQGAWKPTVEAGGKILEVTSLSPAKAP